MNKPAYHSGGDPNTHDTIPNQQDTQDSYDQHDQGETHTQETDSPCGYTTESAPAVESVTPISDYEKDFFPSETTIVDFPDVFQFQCLN